MRKFDFSHQHHQCLKHHFLAKDPEKSEIVEISPEILVGHQAVACELWPDLSLTSL